MNYKKRSSLVLATNCLHVGRDDPYKFVMCEHINDQVNQKGLIKSIKNR